MASENPLLQDPTLPYDLPDWRKIQPEHYLPAITEGMAQQRQALAAVTRQRSMPTFENTIEVWERSGELLNRALSALYTVSSAHGTPEVQAVEEELAPLLAAHEDAILQDEFLFQRVDGIAQNAEMLEHLTGEQRHLLARLHRSMVRAGAALAPEDRARVAEINARLASLSTEFSRLLLADTNDRSPRFADATALDGFSDEEIATAAQTAADNGHAGYALSLPLFSGHPALATLTNPETRAEIMAASLGRGDAGANETWQTLLETVRLRAERARLLGFENHAAYATADGTAGTTEAVVSMLERLAPAAARNARAEHEALVALASEREGQPTEVAAADWAFWTERLRTAQFDVDTAALRPWFEAERVLVDGVFFAATQLYGITFAERSDLHGYHPDVRVFEVFEADGAPLGLFLLDLYTRDTKRGGAWMNQIVAGNELFGTAPVVINNLNVVKPQSGPTLLTFDETNTLFHEFGHALHGLFGKTTYPSLAGPNVYTDFVEFPSQVNEMWMLWPEVLDNYAKHVDTGEPIDAAVVERIRESAAFNEGFATTEYLQAAWLDFQWHLLDEADAEAVEDGRAFQADALESVGLAHPAIPTRYASPYFAHIFAGGYGAGYYSYIWSEVLDADAVAWFNDNGGLTRENGDRFRHTVLSTAGMRDPLDAYRAFRGRDAEISALLARRNLQ